MLFFGKIFLTVSSDTTCCRDRASVWICVKKPINNDILCFYCVGLVEVDLYHCYMCVSSRSVTEGMTSWHVCAEVVGHIAIQTVTATVAKSQPCSPTQLVEFPPYIRIRGGGNESWEWECVTPLEAVQELWVHLQCDCPEVGVDKDHQ